MNDQEKIKELEKRVKELEDRPIPYYPPSYPYPYYPYPYNPPYQPIPWDWNKPYCTGGNAEGNV